jgi:uncharacterized protein (DUF2141 family)
MRAASSLLALVVAGAACGGALSEISTVPEPVLLGRTSAPGSGSAALALPKVGTIRLEILGFRNEAGATLVALFGSAEGFPSNHEVAVRRERGPIRQGKAQFVLTDLPPGIYALSVMHDENESGDLDKSALGVPTEGAGFSQDASATFGAPSFEDASFRVAAGSETRVTIHLRYY